MYALLIGINDYCPPVPALSGCLQDVAEVKAYLSGLEDIDLNCRTLTNESATRDGIAEAFIDHLGQADTGDVALFYYAGHGSREIAPQVFWRSNPDRFLQSILPYDGYREENGIERHRLLADKELRYLIYRIAQRRPHILTIFDCCHSGYNTRNQAGATRRQFLPREDNWSFPERLWSDFLFAPVLSEEKIRGATMSDRLPEGRHVQLSACAPDESAFEWQGRGVFTHHLLDVLQRSDGVVTYYDLQSRLRNLIKNHFRQTPQVYVAPGEPTEVFRFFLDREAKAGNPLYGRVFYRPERGWWMDLGHLQGVSPQAETVKVVSEDGTETYQARIGRIEAGASELRFTGPAPPIGNVYRAFFDQFLSSSVKAFLRLRQGGERGMEPLRRQLTGCSKNLLLAEHEYQADYSVQVEARGYAITPAEEENHPLVPFLEGHSDYNAQIICRYLRHMAQWEFVKNLHNPNTYWYAEHPVSVSFYRLGKGGEELPVAFDNEACEMDYGRGPDGRPGGAIRIRLYNRMERPLYVAFLYLSTNFQIYTRLLPRGVTLLEPGQSVWVMDGDRIELDYEPQVEQYNWKYSSSYFKLITSTEDFDVTALEQDPLPAPGQPVIRQAGRTTRPETNPPAQDWTTRLLTLQLRNPKYRPVALE